MPGQGPLHHRHLGLPPVVVDAGPPPGYRSSWLTGHRGDQGCRGRRVPDPHVTSQQTPRTGGHCVRGHDGAYLEGAPRIFDAHGHANRQIGRAPPDLSVQQARCVGHVGGHAHIDHDHRGSDVGGQDVHCRAASAEVGHHLCGDLGRPRRHPLGQHPVVTSEDGDHGGLGDRRWRGTGNGGQLGPYRLEPAERSRWLGQLILVGLGLGCGFSVDGTDACYCVVEDGCQRGHEAVRPPQSDSTRSSSCSTGCPTRNSRLKTMNFSTQKMAKDKTLAANTTTVWSKWSRLYFLPT